MKTAIDLIGRAMRRAGILAAGETPAADDVRDVLAILNGILEQWSIDGLSVFVRREIVFSGNGGASYTVGPTGDVQTERPDMIDAAYVRVGGSDYGISLVGDSTFSRIVDKSLSGMPAHVRYWPSLPNGRVDLWPAPTSDYEIHLIVNQALPSIEQPADPLHLAPGYDRALFLTLAVDLCVEYQRSIPTGLTELMTDAVASIKRNNINNQPEEALYDRFFGGRHRYDFLTG